MARGGKSLNRRDVLKTTGVVGTAGLVGLAGCIGGGDDGGGDGGDGSDGGGGDGDNGGDDYPALGNFPIEGDTATFGFNVLQSGLHASEGEDEPRTYQLVVKHLSGGGGWADSQFNNLFGDDALDYTIDYVDEDMATDADQTR